MCAPIENIFNSIRIYFEDKVKGLKTHFSILNTIRLQSESCVSSSVVWLVRGWRSGVTNQEAGVRMADVPLLWPDANQKRIQALKYCSGCKRPTSRGLFLVIKLMNIKVWDYLIVRYLERKKPSEKSTCGDSNLTITAGTERHPTRSKSNHTHTHTHANQQRLAALTCCPNFDLCIWVSPAEPRACRRPATRDVVLIRYIL